MQRADTVAGVRALLDVERRAGRTIGFVPTMGALHEGHVSLLRECRHLCDVTVLSIFVNPMQFGPAEDFARYPRDLTRDLTTAEVGGVDVVFTPATGELVPERRDVSVVSGSIASQWEGAVRPGHFQGVLTIVAKLFNIVQPHIAVFGQKDFQQATLIRAMVRDLDFPLSVIVAPTVRDTDGLALSSRNVYLSASERTQAAAIPRALFSLQEQWSTGTADCTELLSYARRLLDEGGIDRIDYLAIVDPDTLTARRSALPGDAVLLAVRVGDVRLIDNVVLGAPRNTALPRL